MEPMELVDSAEIVPNSVNYAGARNCRHGLRMQESGSDFQISLCLGTQGA